MLTANLLIGGADCAATGGGVFHRNSPVSDTRVTEAAAATVQDAERAASAAAEAFETWSQVGPGERRALLNRAADLLEARVALFQQSMLQEVGSTAANALRNVRLGASTLREAASLTTHINGEVIPSEKPGCLAMAIRQPAGVVLGIAPWNAPVVLGIRALAVPLACGNTVILKSSELCPGTHRLLGDLFRDAGFAPGVVNVISNAPRDAAQIVEALIAHPAVRRVNFTGSSKVGRLIGELAARHFKPALLELGGKSPLLVLDDANLPATVNAIAFGGFMNQGQICMSTERVIVANSIADSLVQLLKTKAEQLIVADPAEPTAQLGALIDANAVKRVAALVDEAVHKGATRVCGGPRPGAFMQPMVVDHVTRDMQLYYEESFGPVVAIMRVADDAEAIRVANDSEYGLSAAVFSQNLARALNVAKKIQSGICHINGATLHNEPQMPFGGVKSSGYGRFGSKAEIAEFTDLRWITINTEPERYPF